MRQVKNPSDALLKVFGALTAVSALAAVGGFVAGGDNGFIIGLLGAIFGGIFLFVLPFVWSSGRKQVAQIQALLAGEGLRAHWTFDADEWQRYTASEYTRGMKQTRSYSLWTFVLSFGGLGVIAAFSGALTGLVLLIILLFSLAMTALVGGSIYLGTRSSFAANSKGPGDVFIGSTAVYFGTRFYTWKGFGLALQKVSFEAGDPCVVEFQYRAGSGDNQSMHEVRIPVPRGRETEAQELVNSFYAAN